MNPLEYMKIVKEKTFESIKANQEAIEKLTEQLTTAEEFNAVLFDYGNTCDSIINILSHDNNIN